MGGTKIKTVEAEVEEAAPVVEESVVEEVVADAAPEVKAEGSAEKPEKKATKKKKQKEGEPKYRSVKYQAAAEKVERNRAYPVSEAVALVKEVAYNKAGGSLEAHINTRIKNLRGLVSLPHLSGKELRILAFGNNAIEAGATMAGDDAKIADIEKGKIDFDVIVATPVWMAKLARCARVLGPRGLMPNPKNGTVTDNLEKAITELKAGKVEYKTESNLTTMHIALGNLNQPDEELVANLKTLFAAIGKSKVKKMVLAPTMGPGVMVNLSSIA